MSDVTRPRPLAAGDSCEGFDCGNPELDTWLRARAWQNELAGASRTFVITAESRIVGYYALTVGSLEHAKSPGKVRRNMPDPVPVAILARLAVDRSLQGEGWGGDLLSNAVARTLLAAETFGIRALLVHAISENARAFYERYSFVRSPMEPMTLVANLTDLRKAFP